MDYEKTALPQDVKDYLNEIRNDQDLFDAFYGCDIEIGDEDWIIGLEEDGNWLEDLMGPGESTYSDIRPFARAGSGAVWAVLNGGPIAYIGTEGECGIVSCSICEFMNTVAVWRGYLSDLWKEDILKCEEAFLERYNDPERFSDPDEKDKYDRAFDSMIERHGFTKDPKEVYRMIINGITSQPFFLIKATDDDYTDSYSLLGNDDGQDALERLIEELNIQ